jgi:metal-sulfur cluster biosynthetic enzyme
MNSELLAVDVQEALAKVIDPETGLSIMRMNLIHDLEVKPDGAVSLIFRPSSPLCPMAYALAGAIKKGINGIEGVNSVIIKVENFNRADHLESVVNADQVGISGV